MNIHHRKERGLFAKALILFAFFVIFCIDVKGQGTLLLSPRRLVFDNAERIHEMTVANNGKDTAKYLISLSAMHMNEDGTLLTMKDSNGSDGVLSMIKYYPKHIFLAPGETQVVKVRVVHKGGNKLAPGEYRCHLSFKPMPKPRSGKAKLKKMTTKLKLKLSPVYSFSIPILVRVGDPSTRIEIKDMVFSQDGDTKMLQLSVARSGNMSVFGDMHIYFETPDGVQRHVGALKGFAVYSPNNQRKFSLKLPVKNMDYSKGTFRVICYTSNAENRTVKIAENTLQVP